MSDTQLGGGPPMHSTFGIEMQHCVKRAPAEDSREKKAKAYDLEPEPHRAAYRAGPAQRQQRDVIRTVRSIADSLGSNMVVSA